MSTRPRHPSKRTSKSRTVFYQVEGPWAERPEPLLEQGVRDGIIYQYDDGRGEFCWFEGTPGKRLREFRDKIQACKEKP